MISLIDDPTISVLAYNGFMPSFGDEFMVMTWSSGLSGSFGALDIDPYFSTNGIGFERIVTGSNGSGSLTLRAISAIPEPSTGTLLGLLVGGLMTVRRRSKSSVQMS